MPQFAVQRLQHQNPIAVPLATVLPPTSDFANSSILPASDLPSQTGQVMMSTWGADRGSLLVDNSHGDDRQLERKERRPP